MLNYGPRFGVYVCCFMFICLAGERWRCGRWKK